METLSFAQEYIQNSLSIIPLKPRSKIPLLTSWEPHQRIHASKKQSEEWFSNGHAKNNIGIITGKISRIFAFDIDGEEAKNIFEKIIADLQNEVDIKTTIENIMCIRTGSGNTNIVTHVGLDKHLKEQPSDKEITTYEQINANISNKIPQNNEKILPQKERKGSQSSIDVSHVSPIAAAEQREIGQLYDFKCYYCDIFKTNSKDDYEGHVLKKHGKSHPCYPSKADLEKLGLKAQERSWEI